jgi:uncharacterized membrane protein
MYWHRGASPMDSWSRNKLFEEMVMKIRCVMGVFKISCTTDMMK